MTTSDRVVELLVSEGGYRRLAQPIKIGSLSFVFTHALVAEDRANDLVLVVEVRSDTPDSDLTRKVLALTRALDVVKSKRSVTVVLTSGQAAPEALQVLSRVCRVLPVGAPTGSSASESIRDWISVLLPLAAPVAVEALVDWQDDIRSRIPKIADSSFAESLLRVAKDGAEAVEAEFATTVRSLVQPALQEGNDEQ